jgi:hypothetical protein
MAITYPLLKFGSVYATDTGLVGGTRYISEIDGLDQFQVTDKIGTTAALDLTRYSQYQAVKDGLVVVRFPLQETADFTAIKGVIQTAITGLTTFTLDITCELGTFTFTAKPAEDPVKPQLSILTGKVAAVEFRQYCTD